MSKDIYPQVQPIYGNGVILLILFERYAGGLVTDPILEIIILMVKDGLAHGQLFQ